MRRAVLLALTLLTGPALAHDGVVHNSDAEARAHEADKAPLPTPSGLPFPVKLGGPFQLTDQSNSRRSEADPEGRMQLLFFGYANCPSICSVALPLMADVTDRLTDQGIGVVPVMITVDPERDTVDTIGPALVTHHATFVGLTGSETELSPVYSAFGIEREVVFEDPEHGEIFAHGSHIFLLDGDGTFLTLLPPILSADRLTEIAAAYAERGES